MMDSIKRVDPLTTKLANRTIVNCTSPLTSGIWPMDYVVSHIDNGVFIVNDKNPKSAPTIKV